MDDMSETLATVIAATVIGLFVAVYVVSGSSVLASVN